MCTTTHMIWPAAPHYSLHKSEEETGLFYSSWGRKHQTAQAKATQRPVEHAARTPGCLENLQHGSAYPGGTLRVDYPLKLIFSTVTVGRPFSSNKYLHFNPLIFTVKLSQVFPLFDLLGWEGGDWVDSKQLPFHPYETGSLPTSLPPQCTFVI